MNIKLEWCKFRVVDYNKGIMQLDKFCFWDAKSLEDTVIMMANSLIGLALLATSLYRVAKTLCQRYEVDQQKRTTFIRLHLLLSCWAVENAYSIVIYFTRLNDKQRCQIPDESIRYAFLDKIPTFLIHSAYIKICQYNFRGFLTKVEIQIFASYEIAFFKRLKIYYWLRIVVLGCCEVGLLLFSEGKAAWVTSTIAITCLLMDSVMTCVILIRSMRIFLRKFEILGTLTNRQKRRLKSEYLVLVVTNICAMFSNITFYLIFPFFTSIGQCVEPFDQHLEYTIGHNILGIIFVHFVPVIWILKIYHYNKESAYLLHSHSHVSGSSL